MYYLYYLRLDKYAPQASAANDKAEGNNWNEN